MAGSSDELQLTVLASENRHSIKVRSSTTVAEFRRFLETGVLRDASVGKTLRLITAGRVLSDDRSSLRDSRVTNNAVIHVAMTDRPGYSAAAAAAAGSTSRPAASASMGSQRGASIGVAASSSSATTSAARGALVGVAASSAAPGAGSSTADGTATAAAPVAAGDSVAVDVAEPGAQSPRSGFDRLRAVGLTDEDISLLRLTYLGDVQRDVGGSVILQPGETEASRLLRMEEEWMRQQDPFSEFAVNVRPLILARLGFPRGAGVAGGQGHGGDDSAGEEGYPPYGNHNGNGDPALGFDFGPRSASSRHGPGGHDANTSSSPSSGGGGEDDGGNLSSFLCGVALGSAVGFIMLLWLTSGAFSRKFRIGIVVGVAINLAITLSAPASRANAAAKGSNSGSGGSDAGGGPLSAWSKWGGFLGPITSTAALPLAKYLTPWA